LVWNETKQIIQKDWDNIDFFDVLRFFPYIHDYYLYDDTDVSTLEAKITNMDFDMEKKMGYLVDIYKTLILNKNNSIEDSLKFEEIRWLQEVRRQVKTFNIDNIYNTIPVDIRNETYAKQKTLNNLAFPGDSKHNHLHG